MAPTALPIVMPMPTMPETPPRRVGGNRSGTSAVAAAWSALTPSCTANQSRAMVTTEPAIGSPSRKPAATSAPPTIHGVRRPKRDRVASDSAPAIGWAKTLARNATVVTIARFPTLLASSRFATRLGIRMPRPPELMARMATYTSIRPTERRRRPDGCGSPVTSSAGMSVLPASSSGSWERVMGVLLPG